jgi:hypothetical protein
MDMMGTAAKSVVWHWISVFVDVVRGAALGPNERLLRQHAHRGEESPTPVDADRPTPVDDLRCC